MVGIHACKSFVVQKEIKSGQYVPKLQPCTIKDMLQCHFGAKAGLQITIDPCVPSVLMLETHLVVLVLDNALTNAAMHGLPHGDIELVLSVIQNSLMFSITNLPGPKHRENRALQEEHGINFLMEDKVDTNATSCIGAADSTFLGLSEILEVTQIMGAESSLEFEAQQVRFSLQVELAAAEDLSESSLPDGVVMICCDDDKISRIGYKGARPPLLFNMNHQSSLRFDYRAL